jgi:2-oxoisovalerate dehydrogenase E1 component beta subunit
MPFDIDALITSTRKTGRVVVVHEAPRTCGFGAELIASIQERAMEYLEAPIIRVTGFDTPFPYSLEHEYLPNADRVLGAIRQTLEW